MNTNAPSTVHVWKLAIRPRTLPAAIAPVIVGTALAFDAGRLHIPAMSAALIVALLLQIGANLANDAFDHARGADTDERLGPIRVTQNGLLSYRAVMVGTAAVTAAAMFIGGYLAWRGGWPVLLAGVAAIVAMLAYTGGPLPLGYHGLGEIAVFLFFGVVGVAGTYYVQALAMPYEVILFSVPVGALTAAILVVNNLRDIDTDSRAGKRTVAVRLGSQGTIVEYTLLLGIAYVVPPMLWLAGAISFWWVVSWMSLPLAIVLVRAIRLERGRLLNRRLAQTAQLTLVFCILLAVGVVL